MRTVIVIVVASTLALASSGCKGPAQTTPQVAPSASAAALSADRPTPRGAIDGVPFTARATFFWQDASSAWLSFEDTVPTTDGRYDPLARREAMSAFQIFLDRDLLAPGRYEASAGSAPPGGPIRRVVLQVGNPRTHEIHMVETGWSVTLVIDRVVARPVGDGSTLMGLEGTVDLRFTRPAATIRGRFVAPDMLAGDGTAPPTSAPASPTASPSAAAPASTSPGRTD